MDLHSGILYTSLIKYISYHSYLLHCSKTLDFYVCQCPTLYAEVF